MFLLVFLLLLKLLKVKTEANDVFRYVIEASNGLFCVGKIGSVFSTDGLGGFG